MEIPLTEEKFNKSVIAQHDDNDYEESGWLACVFEDGTAAIGSYSHCSCYGTYDAITGGSYSSSGSGIASFAWSGTVEEMVSMARRTADPNIPERAASADDYDYDHLVEMYKQVIAWDEKRTSHPDLQASA